MISGAEILAAGTFMPMVVPGTIESVPGTFAPGGGAAAFEVGPAQNPFAARPDAFRMRDEINGADARRPDEARPSRTSCTSQGVAEEGNAASGHF